MAEVIMVTSRKINLEGTEHQVTIFIKYMINMLYKFFKINNNCVDIKLITLFKTSHKQECGL